MQCSSAHFYPRPPRGGRLPTSAGATTTFLFLSTPSARRATADIAIGEQKPNISIHALREEGDPDLQRRLRGRKYFYPRPPRGGRPKQPKRRGRRRRFLSTPSARRATIDSYLEETKLEFLSTPSARRATKTGGSADIAIGISIHALREEGDSQIWVSKQSSKRFLSTPSARRATSQNHNNTWSKSISIHALREEGDSLPIRLCQTMQYFYPRPPRGGRR